MYLALVQRAKGLLRLQQVIRVEVEPGFRVPKLAAFLESAGSGEAKAGIDAPRIMLPAGRHWRWVSQQRRWRKTRAPLRGRHCEIVLRACGLANPQWTPLEAEAPGWMRAGLAAFRLCGEALGEENVYEVFPTASYLQMQRMHGLPALLCNWDEFCRYPRNAKDVMDAATAAYTVALLDEGLAGSIPGGDGLGGILLPGSLDIEANLRGVLEWPE